MKRYLTVLDYLDANAERQPEKDAVLEDGNRISYAELDHRAKVIGYGISQKTGRTRSPIVIFMDKNTINLESMYAALFSGNFYVPMDVKTPLQRLDFILDSFDDYTVLTSESSEAALRKFGYTGETLIAEQLYEKYSTSYDESRMEQIRRHVIDTDIMYMIFTSGSTGTPKGVAIRHRNVMDYIADFLSEIGMSADTVCGNQAPFYGDMSLKDVYITCAAGATVCIIPPKYFMFPKRLLKYLDENKVTYLPWVPTAFSIVMKFDGLSKVRPAYLNRIMFSGESMPIPVFNYWKKYYPDAEYIQVYGPTETTGSCTYYFVHEDYEAGEVIPIGRPFHNTGILLLDESGNVIPESQAGTEGEICVYGTCVAAGYYRNPEKTEEAFTDLPEEYGYNLKMYHTGDLAEYDKKGDLVFHSRKDYQIKHMGKRVELGEIESAIESISEIRSCCCVHNEKKDALVLYYIGEIPADRIIDRLKDRLPMYMIPAKLNKVEEMPLLPNGKLNRKLMKEMASED